MYKWLNSLFAVLIIVFSFWETSVSLIIVVISAVFILVLEGISLMRNGCGEGFFGKRTGEEIFLDKHPKPEFPTKKEIEETLERKKKKINRR